jgi:NAD(P)H-hydrate epimerase
MEYSMHLPVLTCAEAAAEEARFIQGRTNVSWQLMQRAAQGIAQEALTFLNRRPHKILVLAGKGKNGADALLAAKNCCHNSTSIEVIFSDGIPRNGLPYKAWKLCQKKTTVVPQNRLTSLKKEKFCLIFDGLLGQGFQAPLSDKIARLVEFSHSLKGLRIAVDLPSGIGDDSTGPAFRADLTISIGCLKRPLLSPLAQRFVGRLRVIDIGLPFPESNESCTTATLLSVLNQPRPARTDKRLQGKLLIIGGSENLSGAVMMNTAAALQAGTALVTTCLPQCIKAKAVVAYPEAMWRGFATSKDGSITVKNLPLIKKLLPQNEVLLIGSGMSKSAVPFIQKAVKSFRGDLVLDADALRPEVIRKVSHAKNLVLLPHAGEFKRLSRQSLSIATGKKYAKKWNAIVVLKGPLTAITDGTRVVYIPWGGPILARGGSGDILAGMVGSLLARRKSLGLLAFNAVELAVTWHAFAADDLRKKWGEEAVRTTQLLSGLPSVLKKV